jgi:hypothetical protein
VSNGEERRRHPRFDVSGLSGVLDGFRLFDALKLSVGGMLIRLPADLALEQRVRVELVLGEETLSSRARVVFLGPDFDARAGGRDRRYRVGLAFVDLPPAGREAIERYITDVLAATP